MLKTCWSFICDHYLITWIVLDLGGHFLFIWCYKRGQRREEA